MKRLFMAAVFCGCAASFAAGAARNGDVAGDWRGAVAKGALRSVAYLHLAEKQGSWSGSWWGMDPQSVALQHVRVDDGHVHFEVPGVAVFDASLEGDTLQGTFHDSAGDGTFVAARNDMWDLNNAP
jgi:hypothetical protein